MEADDVLRTADQMVPFGCVGEARSARAKNIGAGVYHTLSKCKCRSTVFHEGDFERVHMHSAISIWIKMTTLPIRPGFVVNPEFLRAIGLYTIANPLLKLAETATR